MAVAGINNVSVLESSYYGDNYSTVSSRRYNQDQPITRTSFIRKMWRELEDGSKVRDTQRKQASTLVNSNMGSRCSCSSEDAESEDLSINTSEAENEFPWDQNQMGILNEQEDNQNLCLQHSPAIGSADKERVRQVFREWGSKHNSGRTLNVSRRNNCSQVQLICENESKRVRTVRQWLESNTPQAEAGQSLVEEQDGLGVNRTMVGARGSIRLRFGRHALLDLLARFGLERKKEMKSLLESRPVSTFAHRKRIQVLLKGRFLWNQRFMQDEKSTSTAASDLGLLRQTQTVSDLRKGFLSKVNNHEQAHDGPKSDNLSDNGIYHQQNQLLEDIVDDADMSSDNGITYQQNQQLEDIVNDSDKSSENDLTYQETQLLNDIINDKESEGQRPPPLPRTELFESPNQNQNQNLYQDQEGSGSVERNHSAHQVEPSRQSSVLKSRYELDGDEVEVDETFNHLNLSETETDIMSWHEEIAEEDNLSITESIQGFNANPIVNQDDWMYQDTVHDRWYDNNPVVTTDALYTAPDEDNENNTRLELQRLTSRRQVSNLLQSDFRGSLEQLIQSYLARQDQGSESDEDWMQDAEHQGLYQQSADDNEHDTESADPADSWQQHSEVNEHPATELEIINSLRMDMVLLQERMNSMQSTLEACMRMQLELQRSVQQEVSSALNRSSNYGEESLQSCFLCCDSDSDSSPNRGGHVYVCLNCAEKINWSKIKESVRHP